MANTSYVHVRIFGDFSSLELFEEEKGRFWPLQIKGVRPISDSEITMHSAGSPREGYLYSSFDYEWIGAISVTALESLFGGANISHTRPFGGSPRPIEEIMNLSSDYPNLAFQLDAHDEDMGTEWIDEFKGGIHNNILEAEIPEEYWEDYEEELLLYTKWPSDEPWDPEMANPVSSSSETVNRVNEISVAPPNAYRMAMLEIRAKYPDIEKGMNGASIEALQGTNDTDSLLRILTAPEVKTCDSSEHLICDAQANRFGAIQYWPLLESINPYSNSQRGGLAPIGSEPSSDWTLDEVQRERWRETLGELAKAKDPGSHIPLAPGLAFYFEARELLVLDPNILACVFSLKDPETGYQQIPDGVKKLKKAYECFSQAKKIAEPSYDPSDPNSIQSSNALAWLSHVSLLLYSLGHIDYKNAKDNINLNYLFCAESTENPTGLAVVLDTLEFITNPPNASDESMAIAQRLYTGLSIFEAEVTQDCCEYMWENIESILADHKEFQSIFLGNGIPGATE